MEITSGNKSKFIRNEVAKYLTKKGYSCHYEVGLNKGGKARSDIFAFNYKRDVIVVEVKSCAADYLSDSKWTTYLPFCNKMYMAVDTDFIVTIDFLETIKQHSVGLLIVDLRNPRLSLYHSKSVRCEENAKRKPMDGNAKRDILVRLAFRNGNLRTNKENWSKLK